MSSGRSSRYCSVAWKKPRSRACSSALVSRKRTSASHEASPSSPARRRGRRPSSPIFSSTIASKSASLLGKRRKTVALPTPARRAISAIPDVEALLGERQGRRLEDEAAVALGVRAQGALPDLGHALSLRPHHDRLRRIDPRDVAAPQQHGDDDRSGDDRRRSDERELEARRRARVLRGLEARPVDQVGGGPGWPASTAPPGPARRPPAGRC